MAKSGRKPKVVPVDVLDVFRTREDRAEPLIASEIAETLGCSRKTAYNKLRALEEGGDITSKKVGGRSRAYWIPIRSPIEGSESIADADHLASPSGETGRESPSVEAGSDSLAKVEFPVGRDRTDCEAAIHAARDHLRDHGSASMRELVVAVMPAYSAGYEIPEIVDGELVADRYRGAWWRKVVKPGLQALPEIEAPAGGGKWRYIGDNR